MEADNVYEGYSPENVNQYQNTVFNNGSRQRENNCKGAISAEPVSSISNQKVMISVAILLVLTAFTLAMSTWCAITIFNAGITNPTNQNGESTTDALNRLLAQSQSKQDDKLVNLTRAIETMTSVQKNATAEIAMKWNIVEKKREDILHSMQRVVGATSCRELFNRYHINASGYYFLTDASTYTMTYEYCDFNAYPDVTTCKQLFDTYNIIKPGSYMFGQNVKRSLFQRCHPSIYGVYTCQALRDRHPEIIAADSGLYEFQSSMGVTSFRVYCYFMERQVVTVIHHDMMTEIKVPLACEDPGCYVASPQYDVNGTDLEKIVGNSISCKQFVKLRCMGIRFRDQGYGWWVSRTGGKMLYWGGSTTDYYCACGESNSCIDTRYKCNCDQNSNAVDTYDEGYLTDKTKLPLREIRIGDMGQPGEMAWHTIGPLECVGQV